MKNNIELTYHKGKNFGDAVNPLVFKNYLKKLDLSVNNGITKLIGIGTLLGLKKSGERKIIFSSGASQGNESIYGELPVIDENYDVICVRGPKTAQLFNLPDDLVVCDGAYLLNDFYSFDIKKVHKISYIPHHTSEKMFSGYKDLINSIDMNYISPSDDVETVLEEIAASSLIITEAMHGAIISDAFRVPWIPVKCYPFIDKFKWLDFTLSMNIKDFEFNFLPKIHDTHFFSDVIAKKLGSKLIGNIIAPIVFRYRFWQFKKRLMVLSKKSKKYMSNEKLLKSKVSNLKVKMDILKEKYFYE